MTSEISKHIFLDYSEYQRLLEAKRKSEQLLEKVRQLEEKIMHLEKRANSQSGSGANNLSSLIATKENELDSPLPSVLNSITFPPSATLAHVSDASKSKNEKWYFLGIP